ncbi:MAG: AAA family ATPase [Vicinamibacteria bacterium]|nr:AAA family ATPase [Vicinamibacteria bacterium]
MTLGFVVGKFYPPHRGHKLLIDQARAQVDQLIVMLAHHPAQTIPGEVRRAWLEEIHPDCRIHLVPDELEDDSSQWAEFTVRHLGRAPDVVFSSEDYGPVFAGLMGSRHVMVDRARLAMPVSATQVRRWPLRYLDFLEPCVRAWFIKRVVLIGAESTGKTTLAQRLAEYFKTEWVPEFGREHWERKLAARGVQDPPPQWTKDEFLEIAAEQQSRENAAARRANRVLFCDTNAFATGTWHERYQRDRDPRVDAIGACDRVDLYLQTGPDVPFVQDGFRDGELIRNWMDRRFAEQLAVGTAPVARLDGPYETRFERALGAVSRLLEEAGA